LDTESETVVRVTQRTEEQPQSVVAFIAFFIGQWDLSSSSSCGSEVNIIKVFENCVLQNIFGPKRDGMGNR